MSDHPLFEHVPPILRDHVSDYEATLPSILGPKLAEVDLERTFGFIQGAIGHQEALLKEDLNNKGEMERISKWFKGTLVSVKREKRGNLGEKAKIIFEDAYSGEEQSIYTGWVKFNLSFNIPHWELALSRTLEAEAKELIDEEVLLRKSFVYGVETSRGGNRVRFLADIRTLNSAAPDGDSIEGSDDQVDDDDIITDDDIDQIVEDSDASDDFELEEDDYKVIRKLANKKKSSVEEDIASYLDVEVDDLDQPSKKQYDEMWEYAALLLALNAE